MWWYVQNISSKEEEDNSLLQNDKEQKLKHKFHLVFVENTITQSLGEVMGYVGDKKTLQAFLMSLLKLHLQNIYIYCIYISIYIKKRYPSK